MNAGGLVVVALGALLIIIALRNTQSQVFPFFFSTSSTSSSSSSTPGVNVTGNSDPCQFYPCALGLHCQAYAGIPFCV